VTRVDREESFLERSVREARLSLSLAEETFADSSESKAMRRLISRLRRREEFDTLVISNGITMSSNPALDSSHVPSNIVPTADLLELPTAVTDIDGEPHLVVASTLPDSDSQFYFFFSKQRLSESLSSLGTILLRGWAVLVVFAGLVGSGLARQTLRPVSRASEAARSLAEGLLDTRLPVETHDEFGVWATSFNEMADALQEKIDALSEAHEREKRFTSDVAHELRTPLAALMASTSMVRQGLDLMDSNTRWYTEKMLKQAARLRHLVEELMEISRLDAGRERISTEYVDVAELLASLISSRGWKAQVSLEVEPVVVSTDRRRLERITANLIGNAIDHGKSNVRVRAAQDGNHTFVEVMDDGPGISVEHIPHIFERFYKADPARSGGSGLGLSIALENAKLLGGTIDVKSSPGTGALFVVRLPLASALPLGGLVVASDRDSA
jgi:signal transduction histidine kinase